MPLIIRFRNRDRVLALVLGFSTLLSPTLLSNSTDFEYASRFRRDTIRLHIRTNTARLHITEHKRKCRIQVLDKYSISLILILPSADRGRPGQIPLDKACLRGAVLFDSRNCERLPLTAKAVLNCFPDDERLALRQFRLYLANQFSLEDL